MDPAVFDMMNPLGQSGIAETVNMDHIKRHYYVTHDDINPTQVVAAGPQIIIRGEELT